MVELPLFPLNSVLFPGMPLKLHIFEERYKLMINECIEQQTPFGVVLIESGAEAQGPLARPHVIGCTAHIAQVQRLPFGRMNIVANGRERFRIKMVYANKPYLVGEVEYIPLAADQTLDAHPYTENVRRLLKKYLTILENAGQLHFDDTQLPKDTISLAYLGAVILQAELEDKQKLLEAKTTLDMLQNLSGLYRREVSFLEIMLSQKDVMDGDTPFSLN